MTDDELRQLDAKAAEAMGFIVHKVTHGKITEWRCSSLRCRMCFKKMPHYTGADFSLVKREIERRGWWWGAGYCTAHEHPPYSFLVWDTSSRLIETSDWAESEELAGCQAFLKAIEEAQ